MTEHHGGYAHAKRRMAEMHARADNLPAPPKTFHPDRQYLIRVTRAIEVVPGDQSHMLRPDQLIQVSGALAQRISDDIAGAREL